MQTLPGTFGNMPSCDPRITASGRSHGALLTTRNLDHFRDVCLFWWPHE